MVSSRLVRSAAALCVLPLLSLAGCSTRVVTTADYAPTAQSPAALPAPRRVVIADFTTDWRSVRLDQGIGARLQRQANGGDPVPQQFATADAVQQSIADALVENVQKMGLPVARAPSNAPPEPGSVVVQGRVVTINEGNRTRRMAIGFGAGRSDVRADIQVYYVRPDGQAQLLQTYDADSNSGRKPGLAAGAGAAAGEGSFVPGVLTAATGLHSETHKAGVAGEGERLADRVAHNLGTLFARQGWIPQSAVPAMSLR